MENRLVEELVAEVAGADVIPMIRLILGKSDVNEFKIAEDLGITVNQVRNMLYRLNNHNLVDFTRKKDKRKGWYIYFWTFDLKKAHDLIILLKKKKLYFLRKRVEKERQDSYLKCRNDCVRFDSLNAMEHNFRCPECGELLEKEDSAGTIEAIEKQMKQIEADIAEEEMRAAIESKKAVKKIVKKAKTKKAKKKIKKSKKYKARIFKKKAIQKKKKLKKHKVKSKKKKR